MNIENSIKVGYNFKMSQYFSDGFNIFKKDLGNFVGFGVVALIINILSKYLPLIGYVIGLLLTPLYAGFYVVANKIENNEPYEFQTFFEGFHRAFEMIIATIIKLVFSTIIILPIIFLFAYSVIMSAISLTNNTESMETLFAILLILIPVFFMALGVFIIFAPLLIWTDLIILFSDKYKAWDSIVLSFKLTLKNYFPILIFVIILALLNLLGLCFFGLGLLFTIPLTYCIFYSAFKDIVNLNGKEDVDIDDLLVTDDLV